MKHTVVNKKTFWGVAIIIGRPSVFGNPFSHLGHSRAEVVVTDRYTAILRYAAWVVTAKNPELKKAAYVHPRGYPPWRTRQSATAHVLLRAARMSRRRA